MATTEERMKILKMVEEGKVSAEDGAKLLAALNEGRKASTPPAGPGRSKDEIALELMKFVAVTTGYGKGAGVGAGFSGRPGSRTPEEYAESLLELFDRCRKVVGKEA